MGLETGTYIGDLNTSNPVASDKKNVGDDHLRLIKSVAKATFPNADRAFRFPEIVSKTTTYTILTTDENKTILCDTAGGAYTLTLPTPTFDGWAVRVMKTTADVNQVYVVPPSGTINGLVQMRLNVPYVVYEFLWTGSAFIRIKSPGEIRAGTLEDYFGATIPVGYARATGQSLVRADHPELFAEWGTTYGFADGTHFNAPDSRDRTTFGIGTTYAITNTGGEASVVLTEAQLAPHAHLGNTGTESVGLSVTYLNPANKGATAAAGGTTQVWQGGDVSNVSSLTPPHIHGFTTDNAGGGLAHENRPPYIAANKIFRLC
jgi:microcystin-dependent protein